MLDIEDLLQECLICPQLNTEWLQLYLKLTTYTTKNPPRKRFGRGARTFFGAYSSPALVCRCTWEPIALWRACRTSGLSRFRGNVTFRSCLCSSFRTGPPIC